MNLGLYCRRLEVIGTEKNGACERDTQGEKEPFRQVLLIASLWENRHPYPFIFYTPIPFEAQISSVSLEAVFLDVTQCGGALRDIQKTAARETEFPSFTPALTLVIYATIGQNIC